MAVSLSELEKALNSLEEAIQFMDQTKDEPTKKMFRDACIQRFEFCVELSWKASEKVLGSSSTAAKPVIREMAQNGLIQNVQLWFDFIEARNKTSHSYDEDVAKEVYAEAVKFLPEGHKLHHCLKNKK